ncbi:MAG: hypothetical protein HYY92_03320 [Parcubacteria group bacterium]|nr:hypothetical protein [Parcubacteria group bacterium]
MNSKNILGTAKELGKALSLIPTHWDGRSAILEMRNAESRDWRQMEWMGFYFEFLCEKFLSEITKIPGPRYGNTQFDALKKIPWDFKTHATNTSSHKIVVNDKEAIERGVEEYGAVGVIVAVGDVVYNDEKRTFQKWHEKLKGGASQYTEERIQRGAWSRLRKVAVDIKQISFIKIDRVLLNVAGSFQENFRNADGSPRRVKVTIDLEKVGDNLIYAVDF